MKFDCIIPIAGKDCLFVRKNISLIIENLSPDKVYIITKPSYFIYFQYLNQQIKNQVILISEDELIKNVDYRAIKSYLTIRGYNPKTTGWYFQQFLKMGFSLSSYAKNYYVSWDADTIPIKKVDFFSNDSPLFTMKDEYHEPYFLTLKKLLNIDKSTDKSFIAENMIFKTQIMRNMIDRIDNSGIDGVNWCQKIINSMPVNKNNSFSEFETYGSFSLHYYPDTYKFRELSTFRDGGKIYSRLVSPNKRMKLLNYDIITLEHRDNPNTLIGYLGYIHKIFIFYFNRMLDFLFQLLKKYFKK